MNPSPGPWRWGYVTEDGSVREVELFYGSDPEMCVGVKAFDGQSAADNRRLITLVPEMRETLLRLEWSGVKDEGGACPECGAHQSKRLDESVHIVRKHPAAGQNREGFGLHYAGCALAVILEKLR